VTACMSQVLSIDQSVFMGPVNDAVGTLEGLLRMVAASSKQDLWHAHRKVVAVYIGLLEDPCSLLAVREAE